MRFSSGTNTDLVALGTIVNTHGIRGEVRLLPYNPSTDAVTPGLRATLIRDAARRDAKVLSVRAHKQFLLLTFEGISSVSAAEGLIGYELCVPVETLPVLAEGEAYHFQLVGLSVFTRSGEHLGTVQQVLTTAANDVCVVFDGQREILIPFIADVVKDVDTQHGRLIIDPLPGLLDG